MNNAVIDVLAWALLAYMVSCMVAGMVMARRSQRAIRRRVLATGRPVSSAFAFGYLGWSAIKGLVWPLTLTLWIALDRPEPGSFRRPTGAPGLA